MLQIFQLCQSILLKLFLFHIIAHSAAFLTTVIAFFCSEPIVFANAGHDSDVGATERTFFFRANWNYGNQLFGYYGMHYWKNICPSLPHFLLNTWAFWKKAAMSLSCLSFTRFSTKLFWKHFSGIYVRAFSARNWTCSMFPFTPGTVNYEK